MQIYLGAIDTLLFLTGHLRRGYIHNRETDELSTSSLLHFKMEEPHFNLIILQAQVFVQARA